MNQRLPLIVAATALLVALLGSTPLGRAAESALEQVVPRAKKADFAANAGKLNGHKSSVNPTRGQIPVVGADGKLAASIGAVGPKGDPGPQGGPGVSGYLRVSENVTVPDADNGTPEFGAQLPGRPVGPQRWLQLPAEPGRRAQGLRVPRGLGLDLAVQDRATRPANSKPDDPVRGLRERRLVGRRRREWKLTTATSPSSPSSSRRESIVPFLGAGANLCDRPEEVAWELGRFAPSGGELAADARREQPLPGRRPRPAAGLAVRGRDPRRGGALPRPARGLRLELPADLGAPPVRAAAGATARARPATAARS